MATKVRLERRHEERDILVDRRKTAIDLIEHVEGGVQLIEDEAPEQPERRADRDG